jgi:hypothetical protein
MSSEESSPSPFERVDELPETPDDAGVLGTSWDRRSFLKAAALGTAAAAVWQKGPGLTFGPAAAYANDLSHLPCTANDVQIIGTGVVVNEPCECTGTFDAEVVFTVRNITSTGRYCISVHLNDGRDILLFAPDGTSTAFGKEQGEDFRDTIMTGILEDFPCGAGRVCFGQEGVIRGKCDPGTCSTVAWSTTPGQANCTSPDQTPPGGQCRHQQICIVGRGNTTLDCDLSTPGIEESCPVQCGAMATLRLCTSSDPSLGPFTFTLNGQTFGPTTDTCHDFVVGPITETTTFTGCVTDDDGCERCDSVTLTTTPLAASIAVAGQGNCDGVLTLTASVAGGTGCTFAWSDVTGPTPVPLGTGPSISYGPVLDGACHIIQVDAVCGGCNATAQVRISQCVETTVGC